MATLDELRALVAAKIGFELDVESPRIRQLLERRGNDIEMLIRELAVGETYFFRDANQLAALFQRVLPECAARDRPVRILSAGCATGEEPYTVAMGLRRARLEPSAFEILGADINADALARARRGVYSAWALRETDATTSATWFTARGREYVLSPVIREAVQFSQRNLLDADLWQPASYDVVLCRNVLMYFTADAMERTIQKIAASLRPGGYLFLGYAETLHRVQHSLETCHSHDAFYYRRPIAARFRALSATWADEIERSTARIAALSERPAAAAQPEPVVDEAVRSLVEHEQYAEALAVLETRPSSAALRAILCVHLGRIADAEALCGAADAEDAAAAEHVRSLCREADGDVAAALVHAHHAVMLDEEFAMAWVHLALLGQRAADRAVAAHALPRALRALASDSEDRIAFYGGGFRRDALVALCRSQLAALGGVA